MNLLENGLDSFSKAINLLNDLHGKKKDSNYEFLLKDIVISLHHSTETLFKYLIKEKNKYLIYTDLDIMFKNTVENKFKSTAKRKEIQTIQFMDAIQRVIVLYNIDLKEEEYNRLVILNNIRNGLTHYVWEFDNNLAEHTMALLLPTLFQVYSENIKEFDKFACEKGLYVNIKSATKNIEIWNLEIGLELNKKIDKAVKYMQHLEDNIKEKVKVIKGNEKNINYIICPICENEKFKATGNLIVSNNNINYIGECKFCGIEIEKQDAQFINLNFNNYDNYLIWRKSFVSNIVERIMKSGYDLKKEYGEEYDFIKTIFKDNLNKIKEITIYRIEYIIDSIDSIMATKYFHEHVYNFNDACEELIQCDNSFIELEYEELHRNYDYNDEVLQHFRDISTIIYNYAQLTDDSEDEIYNILMKYEYSESYHTGMYINWNGDEVESEISIRVHFNYDMFKDILPNYS